MLTIIFGVIILVLIYIIWNLLRKTEKYEELIEDYEEHLIKFQTYYKQIIEAISYSDIKLKQIDHRGTFSSDDEIGYFFKMVQDLQMLLNSFDHTKPELTPPEELPNEPFQLK